MPSAARAVHGAPKADGILGVMVEPLSNDTSAEVERLQVEAWRTMSPAEKAALITGLTQAAFEMAEAGVRHRHPGAPASELFFRMAIVVLGPDLARRAYPHLAGTLEQR